MKLFFLFAIRSLIAVSVLFVRTKPKIVKKVYASEFAIVCVLVLEFKKTSVCRFRLCRFFISPLFLFISIFQVRVYLTCFGLSVAFLFLSFTLSCCWCKYVYVYMSVCVPFFYPKKEEYVYSIY